MGSMIEMAYVFSKYDFFFLILFFWRTTYEQSVLKGY